MPYATKSVSRRVGAGSRSVSSVRPSSLGRLPSGTSTSSVAKEQKPQQQQKRQRQQRPREPEQPVRAGPGNLLDAVRSGLRDRTRPWHRLAEGAEKRTGVDRLKLFAALVCLLASYLSTGAPGTALLGDAVAFAYPAYVTLAAVSRDRRPGFGRLAVQRRWLTYWMTYVTVLTAERLVGRLLAYVVPYYALLRCVFFVWCHAPVEVNGAAFVYAAVVRRHVAPRLAAATGSKPQYRP